MKTTTATALMATALVLPLGLGVATARAADVVETIQTSERLATFAGALEQAGMAEELRGAGPYTVFAPTDAAFARLPAATTEALFAPANQEVLRELLGYHIVRGEAIAVEEPPAEVETESGTLYLNRTDAGLVIARSPQEAFGLVQDPETTAADELQDEEPQAQQEAAEAVTATGTVGQDAAAGIMTAVTDLFGGRPEEGQGVPIAEGDLAADNGVVHVIDYVLVPDAVVEQLAQAAPAAGTAGAQVAQQAAAPAGDVVEVLGQREEFSRLAQAIEQAGLRDALRGEGPFTVFAPTNAAFDQLPQGAIEQLDQEQLQTLLQHHVVEGERLASDEIPEVLEPMAGGRIDVSLAGNEILLYSAPPVGQQGQGQEAQGAMAADIERVTVTAGDIAATNGVIHALGGVLVPPDLEQALRQGQGQQ